MAYLTGIGYFVLAMYLFVGFCGAAHVFSLRIEYHDRFKKLVKTGQLQNKYPSGISWLDSQNHWMIKGFQFQSDGKLKQLGEVLYDILPFLPPPQNLIFPVRYAYWLKRHWRLFNNDS